MRITAKNPRLFDLKIVDGMGLLTINKHPVAVAVDQDQLDTAIFAAEAAYHQGRMDEALDRASNKNQNQ